MNGAGWYQFVTSSATDSTGYFMVFRLYSNGSISVDTSPTSFSFRNFAYFNTVNQNINTTDSSMHNPILSSFIPSTYYVYDSASRSRLPFWNDIIIDNNNYTPINPSGDTGGTSGDTTGENTTGQITNPSGELTGQIDLTNIENSLTNIDNKIPTSGDIQNIISGETTKITNTITEPANFDNKNISSGDIIGGLDFMSDPYENFWLSMTNGLHTALLGTVRQLPVDWLGYQGYFNLDGLINYPTPIKNILTTVSTVAMVWLLVKWWKIIIDKLTSGDMDEVLAMNEEERHS